MAIVEPTPLTWQVGHNYFQTTTRKNKTLTDFTMSSFDTMAVWELQKDLNMYRLTLGNNEPQQVFLNIQEYFNVTRVTHTERSEVSYLQVMDAVADSKDTIMQMLHDLYQQYIVEQNRQWLLVEGDNKVYELLQALKFEKNYGGYFHIQGIGTY